MNTKMESTKKKPTQPDHIWRTYKKKMTNQKNPTLSSIIYVTPTLPIYELWPNSSTTISQKMINTKKDLTWENKRSTQKKKHFHSKKMDNEKKIYSWSTFFQFFDEIKTFSLITSFPAFTKNCVFYLNAPWKKYKPKTLIKKIKKKN